MWCFVAKIFSFAYVGNVFVVLRPLLTGVLEGMHLHRIPFSGCPRTDQTRFVHRHALSTTEVNSVTLRFNPTCCIVSLHPFVATNCSFILKAMPSLFVFHWISCVSLLTAGDIFCLRCQCLCQCCSAFFAICPLWSLWLFCPGTVAKGQKSQRPRSGDVAKILRCCMKSWVFEGRRISRFFFFQLLMISRCKLCMVESWPQMLTFLCDLPVNSRILPLDKIRISDFVQRQCSQNLLTSV